MLKNNGYASKYIGGYYISQEFASSSSSRVFLGESASPDKHSVAIKCIYVITITSREDEERFLQEVDELKQLQHPYILPLKAAYVIKGTPYIISEYAPNGTLRDLLQQQTSKLMAQDEAITLLSQVGQALHYAHQRNRIHGNLKLQNILFNGKGDALLADFAIASLSSLAVDSYSMSPTDSMSPTEFAYTSPEQIKKSNSKENDQYSLGCIAYELFTGRKPFTTPSIKQPGTYYRTRTLIAPTKLNPALPARIEQAILKAMAKEPSQRYRNVLEFIKALGLSGVLIVPDDPPLGTTEKASQKNVHNVPLFPGLKVATAGATTLAQFTTKAALLRNTFTSLAGFSTLPLANGRQALPASAPGKHKLLRPFLIIASLLFITILVASMALAFSSSRMQRGNQAATGTGTRLPAPQKAGPGKAKTGVPQSPPTRTTGGITVPAQPVQPTQPTQRPQPTPQLQPTLQPSPIHAPPTATIPLQTMLSVAPTLLNASNCTRNNGSFICTVTLSLGVAAGSRQNWYTYSIGVGANFSPSSGTIAPGQALNIQITVFNTCTKAGTFVFVGTKTNITATWNC